MDRHVIKGRGPNRGKYLCWARMAPSEKPTADGFVWLSEQRKACRWKDPRYSGHTWATARAWEHNGYFVKLVGPKSITREMVRELQAFIAEHAAGAVEPAPCYWFSSDFHDAGESFCWNCAVKLVDQKYAEDPAMFRKLYGQCDTAKDRYRAAIDGGFDSASDSPQRCETCEAKLTGNRADEETEALTGACVPALGNVEGWDALSTAIENLSDDDPRWRKILKMIDAAKVAEQSAPTASPAKETP